MGAGEFAGVCVCAVKTKSQFRWGLGALGSFAALLFLGVVGCRPYRTVERINPELIEVSLHFEKPTVMVGEPTWFTLRLHNRSNHDLEVWDGGGGRKQIGDLTQISAIGSDGTSVPQPAGTPFSEGCFSPQKLAAHSSYDFRYFLPSWLNFAKSGHYTITAAREFMIYQSGGRVTQMESNRFRKRTTGDLEVVPFDEKAMTALITELNHQLRADNWRERDVALRTLVFMDEVNRGKPRVVADTKPLVTPNFELLTKPQSR